LTQLQHQIIVIRLYLFFLLFKKKGRLFSRYWREEFIVLYEDSSMAWFKDKSRPDPEVE
jgi:hypothetical protein